IRQPESGGGGPGCAAATDPARIASNAIAALRSSLPNRQPRNLAAIVATLRAVPCQRTKGKTPTQARPSYVANQQNEEEFTMPVTGLKLVQSVAFNALPNYLGAIEQSSALLEQRGINTPLRLAHFFAQALLETGGFTVLRESMNYSAPRLLEIFGV